MSILDVYIYIYIKAISEWVGLPPRTELKKQFDGSWGFCLERDLLFKASLELH
jgi:hypothetical protein